MGKRSEVFEAINLERSYQTTRWQEQSHSNVEFLVYIRDYVEEALHFASRNADPQAFELTQKNLRKIAALAVAAMEQNGVKFRE